MPHAGETHRARDRLGRAPRPAAPSASATARAPRADPRLLEHLAEHRIPLEVCPTSNIATRAVADLDEHPIREMVEADVLVTINSDDPPMFGTDLNSEYAIAARLLSLDAPGVADLAKNAVEASYMDHAGRPGSTRRSTPTRRVEPAGSTPGREGGRGRASRPAPAVSRSVPGPAAALRQDW